MNELRRIANDLTLAATRHTYIVYLQRDITLWWWVPLELFYFFHTENTTYYYLDTFRYQNVERRETWSRCHTVCFYRVARPMLMIITITGFFIINEHPKRWTKSRKSRKRDMPKWSLLYLFILCKCKQLPIYLFIYYYWVRIRRVYLRRRNRYR